MATTSTKIGFVGLGHMGGNMAARFLAAGYTVYGESRDRGDADELVHEGLQWRDTPREVAEASDVLITSLPDDDVLESGGVGRDGILAGLAEPKIWVDMSTVSPRASRELAERVRALGAAMLDAPVSGSVPQVQAGTLTIMVGGDEQAYARVEPILRELGTPTHIGENGQGLVLKLAINISLAVQMLAFAEGLVLAERSGIDRKLAVDVMTESAIGSPMLKARAELVLDLPDEAWFDVGLMQKDVALALDTGRELHVPLPSAATADRLLTAGAGARLRTTRHRSALRGTRTLDRATRLTGAAVTDARSAATLEGRARRAWGPPGNERLTTSTGLILLVLLSIETLTTLSLRSYLPVHIFLGLLLLHRRLKLASTGWRFVRYYTRNKPYRHEGPPQTAAANARSVARRLDRISFRDEFGEHRLAGSRSYLRPRRDSADGPLPPLLLTLTVVTGLVDATSY